MHLMVKPFSTRRIQLVIKICKRKFYTELIYSSKSGCKCMIFLSKGADFLTIYIIYAVCLTWIIVFAYIMCLVRVTANVNVLIH